jgi:hypothetical protein|tara:strand:+ start:73 stop:267 length:195 start_codon:yes stop_codon:yes gene_type:complete
MKKMANLIDSYDRLPESWFKIKVKGDMDKLRKLIHYDDYKYEQDQINELNDEPINPDDGSWKGR